MWIALDGAIWLYLDVFTWDPPQRRSPGFKDRETAASGMSNAFAAQADDPSALHYNPAGMTQFHGVQFMAGALLVRRVNQTSPVRRV